MQNPEDEYEDEDKDEAADDPSLLLDRLSPLELAEAKQLIPNCYFRCF